MIILAIDQGTTGTTCSLYEQKSGKLLSSCVTDYPQHYPSSGWVEHDLEEIWNSFLISLKRALEISKISPSQISCLGITNQRETICCFDREGKQLHRAIVWQDRRMASWCQEQKQKNPSLENFFKKKTGLGLDPYFSATKIFYLLAQEGLKKSDCLFGTIETFLLYRLTKGESFLTDASNASRTLLSSLAPSSGQWDEELLNFFGIKKEFLPEIVDSFGFFGKTRSVAGLPDGIPITAMIGDQQAALLGQGGVDSNGLLKTTYGTGSFMMMNIGKILPKEEKLNFSLLTTVAFQQKGQKYYALEGSNYICGAAVGWLKNQLNFFSHSRESEVLARQSWDLKKTRELLFFPFFSGIGTPYWLPEVKATILGMSRDTSKEDLTLACLEGMALSVEEMVASFKEQINGPVMRMRVDGGAVSNSLLLELQATFSQIEIERPENLEVTSFGAAMGAAAGFEKCLIQEKQKQWKNSAFVVRPLEEKEAQEYCYLKKNLWDFWLKKIYL